MNWTLELIHSLAPDADTLEAARSFASQRMWQSLEGNAQLVWGVPNPSDGKAVRCLLSLEDARSQCNCSNSNNHCQHTLALSLLLVEQADGFAIQPEPPGWVAEWFNAASAANDAAQKLQNETARLQSRDKRIGQMAAGFEDLEVWLADLIRQGLAAQAGQSAEFWEGMAARMVDVKLGSIGRRLRQVPLLISGQLDWPEHLLDELGGMYLLAQSFKQFETLPAEMQQEVLSQAGIITRRDELLAQQGIKSRWQLMSKHEAKEDNLIVRKIWLQSQPEGYWALLLDFVHHSMGFDEHWPKDTLFNGELVYYPSAYPQRAIIKSKQMMDEPFSLPVGYKNIPSLLKAYSIALAKHPWLREFPCFLNSLRPVFTNKALSLVDSEGNHITMKQDQQKTWTLLAISGGQPIGLFGEWTGSEITGLSCWSDGRLIHL